MRRFDCWKTRLAQFHFDSQYDKGREQIRLAWIQRVAGDTAAAKATAEQARNAFEQLYKDQSAKTQSSRTQAYLAARLSKVYALIEEKDLAIKTAERAIMLWPSAEDPRGRTRLRRKPGGNSYDVWRE